MDTKAVVPRHCATYWQKAHATFECLHHEEMFEDWVRLFHGFLGASALFLCLPNVYQLLRPKTWRRCAAGDRSSLPLALLLHIFAMVLFLSHSWLKVYSTSCLSGTEVGAECGQLFNNLIFDVLVVGTVATILCHPCTRSCGLMDALSVVYSPFTQA